MPFIKTPVKGMPEQLPADMVIREYVMRQIKDAYRTYGFNLIETPMIEHIENLTGKQGGENEQLIFKILKRGEKLAEATTPDEMCDSGLRYDLTVPLARFYANNADKLPTPFKAFQMGPSFRAERPQKGRFRQFIQCDIDILGDSTNLAEIELILATSEMLSRLNLGAFKVRVNDRRLLKEMALFSGLPEEKLDTIFIILDKMDKIGLDGVREMLLNDGYSKEAVEKYTALFQGSDKDYTSSRTYLSERNMPNSDNDVTRNLDEIIQTATDLLGGKGQIVFDPTLVRGMSYYTGPIFEVELAAFQSSVAGGGRYDEMIGKYLGRPIPACGFSIGFERIFAVLKDNHFTVPDSHENIAVLIDKKAPKEKVLEAMKMAAEKRRAGNRVLISLRNSNAKFQKEQLSNAGYQQFIEIFKDTY
ncbi:MAG: histidine--tRNA ligase [Alphaproteobacteria bacterium]|nr:histidine--tRNA ligase [Alphaproteobacteria bacterium]